MVLSPLMLELKVLPPVAAATSSYMIFFTSLSSIIQFAVLRLIMWDYGSLFAVVGLLASFVGQTALSWLVNRYQKRSYIIWCIVAVIAVSVILLTVTGGINLAASVANNAYLGFKEYCPS